MVQPKDKTNLIFTVKKAHRGTLQAALLFWKILFNTLRTRNASNESSANKSMENSALYCDM